MEIGPFRVHPIRVAHSVLDSLALAIETPAGVVLASGDFKIDRDAPPDERTDLEALSAWGDRGVLALLSDSTNVEQRGRTGGEDDVLPAFEEVFARDARPRARLLLRHRPSPASSAWPTWPRAAGRRVGFVGRRMVDNAEVAHGARACCASPPSALLAAAALARRTPPGAWRCSCPAARASRSPRCR